MKILNQIWGRKLLLIVIIVYLLVPISVGKSLKAFTDSTSPRHKHLRKNRIEMIPADDSLLQREVSEAVEDRLANVGVGRNIIERRRRERVSPLEWQDSDGNLIQVHRRTIVKSENHDESQNSHGKTLDDHENEIDSESARRTNLLHELSGLRENIDQEIARLQYQSDAKQDDSKRNILVRASRELVRRAEMMSRSKRQSESEIFMPYRACIYLDIPGTHGQGEGEPLIPETLSTFAEIETKEKAVKAGQSQRISETDSGDAAVQDVLWLRMPPNDPLDTKQMITTLYNTVDTLHHEGKDVLFIPIANGYSNPEDVKHGFLKSLQINPERVSKFQNLRIKRL